MVIEPKNQSPITTEVGGVMDLVVVPVFQTRDDYKTRYGAEPPPPDPMRRGRSIGLTQPMLVSLMMEKWCHI